MTSARAKALVSALLLGSLTLQGCTSDNAEASAISAPPVVLGRGVVDVEGGLVSIRSQRAGQLAEITAALGQDVTRGTIVATLQGTTENAEADIARAELQRARVELASARHSQMSLAEQMSRVREAVSLGAESGRARDELQAQLDAQTSAVPVAEASVAAAEARMRAAEFAANSTAIRAPIDGRVVQVNAHLGDVVGASDGTALFVVRPNASLIVRASIPARDASRIHVGSRAVISPTDDDVSVFQGRVLSLGELARKPDAAASNDDFSSDRVVDCVIQLEQKSAIRVGTLVMVRLE